eukprot:CAMPEP_0114649268 /NCGR_PEP_ID=MMETSP0191-20121206/6941_1 /TAXON_ID=126664 /ORGANISM="Sorites sp." /LENGTH=334 /DNA_ID=CAMNT_0001862847 /DNA_START=2113 /DNA_END=3114 /DNA_ORIENTATION=-
MRIEANIPTSNTTTLLDEYYDYPGNQVHVIVYNDTDYHNAYHQLELLNQSARITWFGDGSSYDNTIDNCKIELTKPDFTGQDVYVREIAGHVASPGALFRFNDEVNNDDDFTTSEEQWLGYTVVRGIKAEKWKSTWSYDGEFDGLRYDANTTAYHYFTTYNETITPFANFDDMDDDDVMPLRLELYTEYTTWGWNDATNGYTDYLSGGTSVQFYDIVEFVAGKPDDEWFDVPKPWRAFCDNTEYCANFTTTYPTEITPAICDNGPELPTFPDTWEALLQMSFEPSGYTSFQHEYIDYENNLEKFIVYPTDTRNSPVVFSQHYNTGVNQRVFLEW